MHTRLMGISPLKSNQDEENTVETRGKMITNSPRETSYLIIDSTKAAWLPLNPPPLSLPLQVMKPESGNHRSKDCWTFIGQ